MMSVENTLAIAGCVEGFRSWLEKSLLSEYLFVQKHHQRGNHEEGEIYEVENQVQNFKSVSVVSLESSSLREKQSRMLSLRYYLPLQYPPPQLA